MDILEVMQKHEHTLLNLPNVHGISIGNKGNKSIIRVFVTQKLPRSLLRPHEIIPETLDGIDIDVVEMDDFVKSNVFPTYKDR